MAKPIRPTPPIEGADAEELLTSLKRGAVADELARRAEHSRDRVASLMRESPFQIRLTAEEKILFTEAAERQHLTVSAWLRLVAVRAAKAEGEK